LIACQVFVVLAFFAGVILNYLYLTPIINEGETARMTRDLDVYCMHFSHYDLTDKAQVESAVASVEDPYGGDFLIIDSDARIVYARDGESGNAYDVLKEKYGDIATNLLEYEFGSRSDASSMDYQSRSRRSFFAHRNTRTGYLYFYVADYSVAGREFLTTLHFLMVCMAFGGLLVLLLSFFILRKIFKQVHQESLVQQELDTAAIIQKSMLPRGEKHLISLDADAKLIPAKKVGGDYFCYALRNGILYFCIGDVSGKGVPASLFMSKAVALFRGCVGSDWTPSEMAARINDELCINNDFNMFVTAIVGNVRVFDGLITFVNAGHEPPVVWDGKEKSKPSFLNSTAENIPLGVIDGTEYVEETYQMEKNGLVVLYTDGISEAKNEEKGFIGKSTILDFVDELKDRTAKEIDLGLIEKVQNFERGSEQSDDITLLTFKNVMIPKRLLLKNNIRELKKLPAYLEEVFKECGVAHNERILVRSGLDEALTNCVLYAYDEPGKDIEVAATIKEGRLFFDIKDSGKAFNPLEYESHREELQIGGLGISVFKSNYDEVRYRRESGYNILTLIKNL